MHRLAMIRRQDKEGKVQDAAVNVEHVRYVYSRGSGSYIAYEDEHDPGSSGVTPIGTESPESIDVVIRRLNEPYWVDLRLRVGALAISAVLVIVTILVSS